MNSPNNLKEFLTSSEVGAELGIPLRQVRELCKWGKLPNAIQPYKNGPWLIPPQALADFKKHNRNKAVTSLDKFNYVLFGSKIKALFSSLFVIVGLLFGAISAGADIGGARRQFVEWGIFKAFPEASDGETLIVVTTFYRTEGVVDTNIQEEIRSEIIETAQTLGFSNLRVEITPQVVMANDVSKIVKIGERYNAAMVIWGEDTGVRVTVRYATISSANSSQIAGQITETDNTQLANPSAYAEFVTNDLPSHLTFFALFANGQVAYIKGDREKAIKIVDQAIDYLSSTKTPFDGIAAAYFDLAQMYFSGKQINFVPASQENLAYPESITSDQIQENLIDPSEDDLQQAIHYYTLVIELEPNPYTASGIAFHNRAFAECLIQEWDSCLSDFQEFYEHIHQDQTATKNLASAYQVRSIFRTFKNLNDYEGAINDLDKAVELGVEPTCNGTYAQYYENYAGKINQELEDSKSYGLINITQLIEDYTKIIELEPKECQNVTTAKTYLARGEAYTMIGANELALLDLKMYLQLLPEAENREEIEKLIKSLDNSNSAP